MTASFAIRHICIGFSFTTFLTITGCSTPQRSSENQHVTTEPLATRPRVTEELNTKVVTRIYDIKSLLLDVPDSKIAKVKEDPSLMASSDDRVPELQKSSADGIIQSIETKVDTNSWEDNGGEVGTINFSSGRAMLIVVQTPENQQKVQALLNNLRAMRPTTIP